MDWGVDAKVRQTQIDEILTVLDDVFEQLGIKGGYDGAVRMAESIRDVYAEQRMLAEIGLILGEYFIQKLSGGSIKQMLGSNLKFPTRDQLEHGLLKAPDMTDEDFALLDKLKKLPSHARRSLKEVAGEIKPKGGHPVQVPRSEYAKICDEITSLVRSGMTLGRAKQRVAVLHGCSTSMMNVIWRSRKEPTC